jgi:hypothetical protein
MQEFFNVLTAPDRKELLTMALSFFFPGVTLVAIIGIFQWRKIEQRRMEAALKQEMLERGMSADEIVRVIEASQIKPERHESEKARSRATASHVD